MATPVLMPKWGMSMQEGIVSCWLKKQGDPVEQGEAIVEVESEKATNLVEAPASGVLARLMVREGETVPITTVIAMIAAPGEEISDSSLMAGTRPRGGPSINPPFAPTVQGATVPAPPARDQHRVAASPAARRLAREHSVDLSRLVGTGPDGMIVVEDVQAAPQAPARPATAAITKLVFYSQGHKLDGILYSPRESPTDRRLPGLVFCTGFTYLKELLVPEMARRLSARGYACLVFDYRGFGKSEGPHERLLPLEQVADVRSAVTFLASRPEVDSERIGLVGISLGGSHALYTAGISQRVQAAVAIAPMGDGRRWLGGCRRYWEWVEFLEKVEADRTARVLGRQETRIDAWEIVLPDPGSRAFLEEVYREFPGMKCQLALESAEALIEYCPENMVSRIAPRPVLLVHGERDRLVPVEESRSLFARAGAPRELVIVPEMGHFDWARPQDPRFDHVMETVTRWLGQVFQLVPAGRQPV